MTDNKHTPGPWIKVTGSLVRDSHGMPIASLSGFAYPQPHSSEIFANANLIASAPELLEALEAIVPNLLPRGNVGCWGCGSFHAKSHSADCSVVRAQAAIRKAKGEA